MIVSLFPWINKTRLQTSNNDAKNCLEKYDPPEIILKHNNTSSSHLQKLETGHGHDPPITVTVEVVTSNLRGRGEQSVPLAALGNQSLHLSIALSASPACCCCCCCCCYSLSFRCSCHHRFTCCSLERAFFCFPLCTRLYPSLHLLCFALAPFYVNFICLSCTLKLKIKFVTPLSSSASGVCSYIWKYIPVHCGF